jgi:hypothetical protein
MPRWMQLLATPIVLLHALLERLSGRPAKHFAGHETQGITDNWKQGADTVKETNARQQLLITAASADAFLVRWINQHTGMHEPLTLQDIVDMYNAIETAIQPYLLPCRQANGSTPRQWRDDLNPDTHRLLAALAQAQSVCSEALWDDNKPLDAIVISRAIDALRDLIYLWRPFESDEAQAGEVGAEDEPTGPDLSLFEDALTDIDFTGI